MKNRVVTMVLALLVALLSCFCFVACEMPNDSDTTSGESASATGDGVYALNEPAELPNLRITADTIERNEGRELFTPDDGNVFVGVQFTIENISDEEQAISSVLLFNAYADGVQTDYSLNANLAFDKDTLDGSISPGKKMIGYYSVEVPSSTQTLEIEVQGSWLSSEKVAFKLDVPQ